MLIKAPLRGIDRWGSGAYLAPRGTHNHHGVDMACYPGSMILSMADGVVTKIGYPYDPRDSSKGYLRYVEVTDAEGVRARYFYVDPMVATGDKIKRGDELGTSQSLQVLYPGITDHVHFELKDAHDYFLDPRVYPKH